MGDKICSLRVQRYCSHQPPDCYQACSLQGHSDIGRGAGSSCLCPSSLGRGVQMGGNARCLADGTALCVLLGVSVTASSRGASDLREGRVPTGPLLRLHPQGSPSSQGKLPACAPFAGLPHDQCCAQPRCLWEGREERTHSRGSSCSRGREASSYSHPLLTATGRVQRGRAVKRES